MFETLAILGNNEDSIRMDTRVGSPIENSRSTLAPPKNAEFRFVGFVKDYGSASWQVRAPVDIHYNCAGHVWASRRTSIYKLQEWAKILREDGYSRTSKPVPDDIVIYYMDGDSMAHVARVHQLIPSDFGPPIAVVVSKWGDTGGEVCHFVHEVPHSIRAKYEFWTDRQGEPPTIERSIVV